MSRRSYALLLSTIACLGWVMPGASAAPPAGNGAGASKSRLATFETSTGEKYFALSLSLDGTARDASQDQDIVVMLDTSASQAGAFRDDALAALESLAQGLGANDRVQIFAVDLRAVPMMPAFAPANAGDIAGAMNQLRQRAPLGSTDMSGALAAALRAFEGSRAASRSVIYIGDGVSRANFLASTEFESLVNALVDQQISVTSLAIGPERDIALLAALANHTGGALVVDNEGMTGQQSGQLLAQASRATVAWPVNATFAGGVKEYFPKKFPPLRSDRDSIVVGTLQGDASELTAQLKSNGQVHGQRWLLQAEPANADFDFLPHLVELARADGGMRLPTLGSDGLRESARVMQRNAEGLTRLSEHALVTGDLAGAKVAAEAAMKQDPANPEAALVRETAVKLADAGTRTTDTALRQVTPLAPAVNPETTEGGEGRLLGSVETSSALRSEVIQTEVEQGLNAARRKMSSSPELAKQDLILLLDSIDQATELPPEVRGQLRDRVQTAIREAARRQIEVASAQAQAQENQVAAIERLRLTEELDRRQAKIQQLLSRFNYLLEEGHFLAAEEDVAEQVRFLEPDSTAGVSALWRARTLKNVKEMQRFRDLRDRNFVDTLYRVEDSAIPFPDEPPIVYPAAVVWELITMSRKQ
ncbi:MAG: VWA domain-containing protein, partial [Pirellulaceae bacterium]